MKEMKTLTFPNGETYEIVDAQARQSLESNNYATESYVRTEIAKAQLEGADVDLSDYALKTDIPTKMSQLQNDSKDFKTATIYASGWSSEAPYTQNVAVEGIIADDKPHISAVYSGTLEEMIAQKTAWGMVSDAETAEGSISFICFEEKPTTDISVQIEVNR